VGVVVCVGFGVDGVIVVGIPVAPFVLKLIDCGLLQSLVESTYVFVTGFPQRIYPMVAAKLRYVSRNDKLMLALQR